MEKENGPRLGAGDVVIVLAGEEYVLKPTPGAFKQISRRYGGIVPATQQIARLNFEAIVDVIAIGLNLTATGIKNMDLENKVYETGLADDGDDKGLCALAIEWLTMLSNGGRPIKVPGEGEANHDTPDPQNSPRRTKRSSRR